MTDRVNGLTVYLEEDYRIDDVQAIIDSITMTRGVLKVEPIIVDSSTFIAEERGKFEIKTKIYDFLRGLK